MAVKDYIYRVQRQDDRGSWHHVIEDASPSFCRGWVSAMGSLYPGPPYRVIKHYRYNSDLGSRDEVIMQIGGRGKVHTN